MTTVEMLRAAKAKIEKPEQWCQRSWAKDSLGLPVDSDNGTACEWCALGAMRSICASSRATCYLSNAAFARGYAGIAFFNDGSTHFQVMQMYDSAIAMAEEENG